MKLSLFKGLDEQQSKDLRASFAGSGLYREALSRRLLDKLDQDRKELVNKDAYDSPGWAYRQADNAGYERAIRELISLLNEKN